MYSFSISRSLQKIQENERRERERKKTENEKMRCETKGKRDVKELKRNERGAREKIM